MVTETPTRRESTPLLVRMVAVHVALVAVLVAVPLVVLGVLLTGSWVAIPLLALFVALVVAGAFTAWRMRTVDIRIAELIEARLLEPGEYPRLDTVVDSVAMAAGISPPRVHLIESPGVNAMTWGASDGPASIAVTSGLLDAVDRVELEAVVAHQATTVNDRPIDVITLGAMLFGPVARGALASLVADFIHTTTDPRSIVLSDIEGSKATRYPPGMVAALEKVAGASTVVEQIPAPFAGLCFASPVADPGPFDLHPPLADRIDLMREW